MAIKLIHGDNLEVLKKMKDNRMDSLVCDPPYGIKFLNKKWDYEIPPVKLWQECLRVLKPGGYALVACGTRTQHRMAVNLEDAGFIIIDIIGWLYGQGFPHSHNVAKAIEGKLTTGSSNTKDFSKLNGERLERGGWGISKLNKTQGYRDKNYTDETEQVDRLGELQPTTEEAKKWLGWGTRLKPALELWTLCQKPIEEPNIAENILNWGVGAMNIDACRVPSEPIPINKLEEWSGFGQKERPEYEQRINTEGRWPANIIHDGSEEVVVLFPETGKSSGGRIGKKSNSMVNNVPIGRYEAGDPGYGDSGSAARFFYVAKPSKREKNEGLDDMPLKLSGTNAKGYLGDGIHDTKPRQVFNQNHHATVKPIALMKHLVTLITPPNGKVLDPFMGSGTTGIACVKLGYNFIGIDLEEEYVEIAKKRIEYHTKENEDEKESD